MKYILVFALSLCLSAMCRAQQANSRPVKNIDLNEVVIRNNGPAQLNRKVRSENVYFDFKPGSNQQYDSMYFATLFPAIDEKAVTLSSVELTILPFDSSLFDLKFFVYQVSGTDTFMNVQRIDVSQADKHHKLKLYLSEQDIKLQAAPFYLGYGFSVKHIDQPYSYRMHCSSKGGEGALFSFGAKGLKITTNPAFPYVFPFRISYYPSLVP